jgi:hypothetical protein
VEMHPTTGLDRRHASLLVAVLVLVNAAAIWGQAGWALEHIVPDGWDWWAGLAISLGFAAALELIGVFLAMMADESEARDLPSGGVRLASYAVGLFSGGLNFSHFLGVTFAAACAFGFLSAVSPFLWGIYARVRRGRPVAPSRRFWHPVRSVELIRLMAWEGIASELDGIRALATPVKPALTHVASPLRVFAGPHSIPGPAVAPEPLWFPKPQPEPEVRPVPQPSEPERVTPGPAEKPAAPERGPERRSHTVHMRMGKALSGPDLKADAVALVRAEGLSNAQLAKRYTPELPTWRAREFVSEARKPGVVSVNGHRPDVTIP